MLVAAAWRGGVVRSSPLRVKPQPSYFTVHHQYSLLLSQTKVQRTHAWTCTPGRGAPSHPLFSSNFLYLHSVCYETKRVIGLMYHQLVHAVKLTHNFHDKLSIAPPPFYKNRMTLNSICWVYLLEQLINCCSFSVCDQRCQLLIFYSVQVNKTGKLTNWEGKVSRDSQKESGIDAVFELISLSALIHIDHYQQLTTSNKEN